MEFLKKLDLKPANILKIAGIALLAIILLVFAIRMISASFNLGEAGQKMSFGGGISQSVPSYAEYDSVGATVALSSRNVAPTPEPPDRDDFAVGDDAENFEVTEYKATIETRRLDPVCESIDALKVEDFIIFEKAYKYDYGCNYSFKVKKGHVEEVFELIKSLDPKELAKDTRTIKRLIEDFTSETDILKNKRTSIDETLKNAVEAYDEITALAVQTRDAESLAKIIDSKIQIIERLTQQRININAQLERLERAKAEQLDRLEYTYFRVNVLENKFIDGRAIKDSWKKAVKQFVKDINQTIQDISVNLLGTLLRIFQYALYLLILLIIVKYGWKLGKYIWKK